MAVHAADQGEEAGKPGVLEITTPRDGCVVVSLVGEHDVASAPTLRSTVEDQAATGGGIVVSVTEAEFIDSSIVHELFRGDSVMLKVGRRLVLHLGADVIVERVLEIGGVLAGLLWTDSLPEAIEFACQVDAR